MLSEWRHRILDSFKLTIIGKKCEGVCIDLRRSYSKRLVDWGSFWGKTVPSFVRAHRYEFEHQATMALFLRMWFLDTSYLLQCLNIPTQHIFRSTSSGRCGSALRIMLLAHSLRLPAPPRMKKLCTTRQFLIEIRLTLRASQVKKNVSCNAFASLSSRTLYIQDLWEKLSSTPTTMVR